MASGQAHECRTLQSVANSAVSVEANSAEGGHVWIHVANLGRAPANARRTESQEGKTMFASEEDFKSAWEAFKSAADKRGVLNKPAQCRGKADSQNDCVLAKDVGITDAYICRDVDRTTKLCTNMEKIKPKFVVFYCDGKPQWHLNTAYPADSNPGAGSCKQLYPYVEDDYVYERRDVYGRRGGRRESRHHRARHGAEYIIKIIKLFTKIMNLNTMDN